MEVDTEPVEASEDKKMEESNEKTAAHKGGLNELLGDGKDDLEFDFESEKPALKKQKTNEADDKIETCVSQQDPVSIPQATKPTPEKKSVEEDLIDFELQRMTFHIP